MIYCFWSLSVMYYFNVHFYLKLLPFLPSIQFNVHRPSAHIYPNFSAQRLNEAFNSAKNKTPGKWSRYHLHISGLHYGLDPTLNHRSYLLTTTFMIVYQGWVTESTLWMPPTQKWIVYLSRINRGLEGTSWTILGARETRNPTNKPAK
jgi:hypothetical protein